MLPLYVTIEPDPTSAEVQAALLHACSEAVAPRSCESGRTLGASPSHVVVRWSEEGVASIQVVGSAGVVRSIQFAPEDPLIERYRTVGYAVGTLALVHGQGSQPTTDPTAQSGAPPASAQEPDSSATSIVQPDAAPLRREVPETNPVPQPPAASREQEIAPAPSGPDGRPEASPPRWLMLVGAGIGTGIQGTARTGFSGLIGAGNFVGPLWLTISGGYYENPPLLVPGGLLRTAVARVGAGVGIGATNPWLTAGVTVGPTLEVVTAGSDRSVRTLPTLIAHGFAAVRLVGPLQIGARLDGIARFETTQVTHNGVLLAEIAPFGIDASLDLGLAF